MKQDLKNAQQKNQEARAEYNQAKEKESVIATKIEGLEKNISDTESEIDQLQGEIGKYKKQVDKVTVRIKQLETEVSDQDSDLNARLRIMYMTGDQNILEVLLGSENIIDFMSNLDMIKEIHAQDVNVLDELQAKLDEVEDKKAELVKIKKMLEASKKEQEAKKATLAENKKKLDKAKEEAHSEALRLWDEVEETESDEASISSQIQSYEASQRSKNSGGGGYETVDDGNYTGGNGTLAWPVRGRISSEFGYRVHPIYGYSKLHKGMDIAVPRGTPIHAAGDGVVISAGWGGGYGNMVIISHGGGISTLYGHNSGLAVSSGQRVSRGQVIAYCGSTGASTGPHCHFEVRVNGEPRNPRGWL
jgi:murein DD-endopeptidase MepM/ murein hydrolase activator NlpD